MNGTPNIYMWPQSWADVLGPARSQEPSTATYVAVDVYWSPPWSSTPSKH